MAKPDIKSDIFFITGTDTGVGKTVLSLLLMQFFSGKGQKPFYLKPFQTGCRDPYDKDSDAKFIYNFIPQLMAKDPADSVVFCHQNPKAPLFAARDQGETVDAKLIQKIIAEKSSIHHPVIVEGAGGVMVPIDGKLLMIDLIKMLNARPIIAARAGLGTINHTLLTIEVLRMHNILPSGIVLMDAVSPPTPRQMVDENIEAIEKFSGIKVAGVIGRIENFSSPDKQWLQVIEILTDNRQRAIE